MNNLLYQLKVKLFAQKAGLEAVRVENNQIAVSFSGDVLPSDLPDLGPQVRRGKTSLWLPYAANPNWQTNLIETLQKIGAQQQIIT